MIILTPQIVSLAWPTVMVNTTPYKPRLQSVAVFSIAALIEKSLATAEQEAGRSFDWSVSVQTDVVSHSGTVRIDMHGDCGSLESALRHIELACADFAQNTNSVSLYFGQPPLVEITTSLPTPDAPSVAKR